MVSDKAFIFNLSIPWGKTLFFSNKVKVICQGHGQISRSQFSKKKNGCCGGISVSQTQLVSHYFSGIKGLISGSL